MFKLEEVILILALTVMSNVMNRYSFSLLQSQVELESNHWVKVIKIQHHNLFNFISAMLQSQT